MKKAGVASPLAGRLPRDRVAPRPGGSPLRRSARTSARRARRAPRVLSLGGRGGSGGVGEKRVVIVPELPLVVGAPRRFGRLTRLRVEPIDWGIPVRVSNLPGIPLENLRERRLGSLAEGVMEVGEFHDGHGCLGRTADRRTVDRNSRAERSEEHTSELQSRSDLVCRLLLEKKKHMSDCYRRVNYVGLCCASLQQFFVATAAQLDLINFCCTQMVVTRLFAGLQCDEASWSAH